MQLRCTEQSVESLSVKGNRNQCYLSEINLSQQIDKIVESLKKSSSSIESIDHHLINQNYCQVKKELESMPDFMNIANQIAQYFHRFSATKPFSHSIYEIPTEISPFSDPQLYEIPVEILPIREDQADNQMSLQSPQVIDEQTLAKYFDKVEIFQKLPQQIQRRIKKMQNGSYDHLYEIPIQMHIEEVQRQKEVNLYEIPVEFCLEGEKEETIKEIQSYRLDENEDWQNVDDQLMRMSKIMNEFPTQKQTTQEDNEDINLTGNIAEDLKLLHAQNKSQPLFYQIPVEFQAFQVNLYELPIQVLPFVLNEEKEVQCDIEPQFIENPIEMQNYIAECQIHSQTVIFQFQPFQQKLEKVQNKEIHLSASIESVMYGCKGEENKMKPATLMLPQYSNRGVSGWGNHPELDFCDSAEMGEKSNDHESFANSLVYPFPKESCNFKESEIRKKSGQFGYLNRADGNSIYDTFKVHHPIQIIMSQSSSEGNQTDREMYLSEMQEKQNVGMNIIEKASLNEQEIEASQYFDMKEKNQNLEEENVELEERLKIAQNKMDSFQREIKIQKQALKMLQMEVDEKEQQLRVLLDEMKEEREDYEQMLKKKSDEIYRNEEQNESLKWEMEKVKEELEKGKREKRQMRESIEKAESQFFVNLQKLQTELAEKDQYIRSIEIEYDEIKQFHKAQISDFIKVNEELRTYIQELNRDIENKKGTIQHLRVNHDELITHLEVACREKNQMNNVRTVYLNEYDKMKEDYEKELLRRQRKIKDLNYENQRLHKEVLDNIQAIQYSNQVSESLRKNATELQEQLAYQQEEFKNSKFSISPHIEAEMDYLRRELILANSQVEIRDLKIQELTIEFKNKSNVSSELLTIDFYDESQIMFIEELKSIISKYEKVIASHHKLITELQNQVYQYVGDALEKEEEAQKLHENVLNYESDINEIMLEKIAVDLENKKLRRMIGALERKVSARGNRLMHVGNEKTEGEDVYEKYEGRLIKNMKSQNSTIKLGFD